MLNIELKQLRKSLGLNQSQFGEKLGYINPQIRVSELETGLKPICERVKKLCKQIEKRSQRRLTLPEKSTPTQSRSQ